MHAYVPLLLVTACLTMLIVGVGRVFTSTPYRHTEAWRDRAPLFFRLCRPFVNVFVDRVRDSMKPYQRDYLQTRLDSAGLSYTLRPEEFVVTRRVSVLLSIVFILYVYFLAKLQAPWQIGLLALVLPVGYFYPDIWLRDRIKRRHHLIDKQFPFFLDLLVLSMRAGLNFSSAMAHTIEKLPDGPVREEFSKLLREVRTGVSRKQALISLGKRINLGYVTNFVSSINQSEDTGGEIGDILVEQAKQRRSERFLKAEKLANQAPVKMLAPLIGLMFPITFIVVMFPVIVKAYENGVFEFFGLK